MACVFVDVDGTLLAGASVERLFVAHLWARRMLGPRQIGAGLGFFLRFGPRYGRLTAVKNKAYLAGLQVGEIEGLATQFVRRRVSSHVRPSVLRRLQAHLAAGEPVSLLSGAPDFLVRPLAACVGVGSVAATVCAQKAGVFSANAPVFHPFYEDKLIAASQRCAELGFALDECTVYADDVYDLPLLREVGKPIAVHPDRPLRRAAEAAGWEIIET